MSLLLSAQVRHPLKDRPRSLHYCG
ncbi:cold-shock protein, partial [Yersinia pestis]